ncbi:MAG: hypothetical protein HWD86_05305 [Kangiellaceae bacterium]|nr:hypothetical protein [Kangiellaceae bacterium]
MRYFAIILLFVFGSNSAADEGEYDLSPLCDQLYKISTSALMYKENGMTKEELLAPLPDLATLLVMPFSKKKILAQNMHRIADEIYNFDGLEMRSYSAYTAESCHRGLKNLSVPESFEEAYPKLLKCNEIESSDERINCGMAVSGSIVERGKNAPNKQIR